jgi:long-subunit fatty acid transport protein
VTYLYQQFAALTGFQVAWVVNHKLSFGAKFDILTSPVKINKYINSLDTIYSATPPTPNPIHPLSMSAMINIGYIFRSDKKISIEPDLGVGWTYMSFSDPKIGWIDTTEAKRTQFISNYLIVNPSLSVIWNTTKYFRIGVVAGAQGVFGTDYLRLKTYRIRSLYGGLFLRFGTF